MENKFGVFASHFSIHRAFKRCGWLFVYSLLQTCPELIWGTFFHSQLFCANATVCCYCKWCYSTRTPWAVSSVYKSSQLHHLYQCQHILSSQWIILNNYSTIVSPWCWLAGKNKSEIPSFTRPVCSSTVLSDRGTLLISLHAFPPDNMFAITLAAGLSKFSPIKWGFPLFAIGHLQKDTLYEPFVAFTFSSSALWGSAVFLTNTFICGGMAKKKKNQHWLPHIDFLYLELRVPFSLKTAHMSVSRMMLYILR